MRKQFLAVILALSVLAVPSGLCEVTFDWWGMIVSVPSEGIVECGSPISMAIEDDFIVNGLETNEYLDDEGEPEYEWYLNGSATPCKTGQAVVFSTGESGADVPAGDFTVSVSGSRTCKVGWTEELVVGECTCGCNDITCDCQWGQPIGGGAKGNGCSCKCSQNKAGAKGEDNDAKRQGDYRSIVIPIYHFEDIATGIVALAQRAFLAAKVVIRQGGADITDSGQNVKVGKGIVLHAEFKNSAVTPDSFSWSIPGVYFKNFNENATSHPLVLHTPYYLSQEDVWFYWSSYSDGNGGTVAPVSCYLTLGSLLTSGTTYFNVNRPNIILQAIRDQGHTIKTDNLGKFLIFGGYIKSQGILVSYNYNTIPSIFRNDNFCWSQVINYGRREKQPSNVIDTYTNGLDNQFEYPHVSCEPNKAIDTPQVALKSTDSKVCHTVNATMYLMYKPASESGGTAWVPVSKVEWSCDGTAIRDVNGDWIVDEQASSSTVPVYSPTDEHPNWDVIVLNK